MKLNGLAAAACALAIGLMLAGCGGGGGSSSSSITLAQGSDPAVNGSGSLASSAASKPEEDGELLMMTVDEAISRFKQLDPAVLGLSKESMSEYDIYPTEKAVPVDGMPCLKIIVYGETDAGTNQPEGTFLLARDGTALYRLEGKEVTKLDMERRRTAAST